VAALLSAAFLPGLAAQADEKPADAALLEFLGSVDASMPGWHKYVTDTDKAAARAAAVPVKAAKSADPPPAPSSPPRETPPRETPP
jgi:hypothetical protein